MHGFVNVKFSCACLQNTVQQRKLSDNVKLSGKDFSILFDCTSVSQYISQPPRPIIMQVSDFYLCLSFISRRVHLFLTPSICQKRTEMLLL
jgi:hypothetical protein